MTDIPETSRMADLPETSRMRFWHAINEGRRERGLPEALFANVRALYDQAMQPTEVEVEMSAKRAAHAEAIKQAERTRQEMLS